MSAEASIGQAVILASAPIAVANWLIVGDENEVSQHLVELLKTRGQKAQLAQADEYERCLNSADYQGVVDVTSLGPDGTAAALCEHVLRLAQTLIRARRSTKLWVVTRGAQPVEAADQLSMMASTLWGLGRGIACGTS